MFAISGAIAAVKHRLDIFGVMVIAFAAGNAGGIARDVLIFSVIRNTQIILAACIGFVGRINSKPEALV